MLEVIRGGSSKPSDQRSENFTGEVWRDVISSESDGVSVGNVFFAPRARTHWHAHHGGQFLTVTAGEGLVGDRGGVLHLRAGDSIWTPPGHSHWHGASPDHFMMHTAVSINGADWQGEVSEDEYGVAPSTHGE